MPLVLAKDAEPFGFTCSKCYYRGNKNWEPEFLYTTITVDGVRQRKSLGEFGRYPDRCGKCKVMIKKYCRMKKSLQRLTDYSMDNHFGWPKMLTVALPSKYGDDRSKLDQIKELRKKWRKLRAVLKDRAGIDAGISVVECTTKIDFSKDLYGIPKYHAHIHAAVCMPYMKKEEFVDLCSTAGESVGLGRLNIVGRKTSAGDYKSHLANYLSKYLSKSNDTGNASNFGKLIGYRSPPRDYGNDSTCS